MALLLASGVAYLDKQGVDWQQKLAALRERFPETPPVKEVRKPISPSELPPSFDIAYADQAGNLVAAGRGEAGWTIRLGSGTQTLGETKADENNEWVLAPEEPLAPGEHTLALLEIDPVSRRNISGQRSVTLSIAPRPEVSRQPAHEASRAAEPVPAPGQNACSVAIVKRGDTLWELAHHCYGDGTKYSKIFESNRQKVRDPNLIYPDQQLALPH